MLVIPFLDFQNDKKFDQCKVGTLIRKSWETKR